MTSCATCHHRRPTLAAGRWTCAAANTYEVRAWGFTTGSLPGRAEDQPVACPMWVGSYDKMRSGR